MTQRLHYGALLASLALATAAHAQVSTFTRDGWAVATPPIPAREAPGARLYAGRVFVNAHADAHPGLARSLERPNFTDRGSPADYGADPTLADLSLYARVGPTVVRVDPWTPLHGRGHLRDIEMSRAAWLDAAGLTAGVRTHVNEGADAMRSAATHEPAGVIRVRPAPPATPSEERFVLRDAE